MTRRGWRLCLLGWLVAVAAVLGGTGAAAHLHARLSATSGLRATYSAEPDLIEQTEARISRALLDRLARRFDGRAFRATWRGYVIVPATGTYRFAVPAADKAWLRLGGRDAADSKMQLGPPIELTRGLHELVLDYVDHGGARHLRVLWARGDGALHAIPPLLLVPELRDHAEVRQRRGLVAVAAILPLALLLVLVLPPGMAAVRVVWRMVKADAPTNGAGNTPLWLLASSALLFAAGAWWGIPSHGSWAPDEVTPGDVVAAMELGFAGGWATIYPPLHYMLLAVLHLPHHLAATLGLLDPASLDPVSHLALLGRLLSVAMAVGIVAIVHAIGREQFGVRAGLFAALITSVALPLTYYGKTSNLDVPYVFWLTLSLLFYLRACSRSLPRDFHLFCLAAVAAICAKDQAYGFYVLPAAYMGVAALLYSRRTVRPPGVPAMRTLGEMAGVTVVAFMVFWNLPFNPEGFREHVRLITGPASQVFRMFPSSPSGYARLLGSAVVQMGHAMSWPLAICAAAGVVAAIASRQRLILFMLLPGVSYVISFISVVMYHYDRFFLGPIVIGAIAGGWWLQAWTAPGTPGRRWKLGLVTLAIGYAASRAIALDLLMITDARYEAERTLRNDAAPHQHVAAAGMALYLPRPEMWPWRAISESLEDLAHTRPDYVVVNAGYALRFPAGSSRGDFYAALASGDAGYTLAGRHETRFRFSPLALERRFRQLREDEFSNLPKVSPVIEIYVRE